MKGEADPALLRAIDEASASLACAVHSFDHRIVARLGALRPSLRSGILSTSTAQRLTELGGDGLGADWPWYD